MNNKSEKIALSIFFISTYIASAGLISVINLPAELQWIIPFVFVLIFWDVYYFALYLMLVGLTFYDYKVNIFGFDEIVVDENKIDRLFLNGVRRLPFGMRFNIGIVTTQILRHFLSSNSEIKSEFVLVIGSIYLLVFLVVTRNWMNSIFK